MRIRTHLILSCIIPAFALTSCGSAFQGSINSEVKTAADLIEKRENDKAAEILQRYLDQNPDDPRANYYAAVIDERKNNKDAALEKLNRAIEKDPGYAEAYSERALVLTRWNDNDAALADINHAVRLAPKVALNHLRRALIANNSKDYPLALEALDQVEKLDPKTSAYWITAYRAEAYTGLKDYKHALDLYNKAAQMPTKQPAVYFRRALVKAKLLDFAGAKTDCLTYLKQRPDDPPARFLLGALTCVEADVAGGRKEYETAIAKSVTPMKPADIADIVDMGADYCASVTELIDTYLNKKDPGTAFSVLTGIEAHRPLEPQEQFRLAKTNLMFKRDDRGVALLNACIAMSPDYIAPRIELIRYYASSGLTRKAMELQREAYAVARSPQDKAKIAGALISH
jgi:tetratricopeptide (TPR) repeat protein